MWLIREYNKSSWDNSIGATKLKAFYYVSIIEIPTPRWTLYDKIQYGAEISKEVPLTQTERGYTSSIWYSPK